MAERPMPHPALVLRSRRLSLRTRRGYGELLLRLGVLGLALWLAFSQVFLLWRNRGLGMFPSMKDGDLILAYRLQETFVKGDAVVYTAGGSRYLGRVAAGAGDVVMMDDSGSFTVNGNPQDGEILYPTFAAEPFSYPMRVQEGMVFVLGDYRTHTQDSRDFGPIPLDDIQGKVIAVVRRRGL